MKYIPTDYIPDSWDSTENKYQPLVTYGPPHPERLSGPVTFLDPTTYVPQPIKRKYRLTEKDEKHFEEMCQLCGL